ncbi:MAG: chromate efflux transporter [Planctomycetaceae bacterium]|nr:chromate efflux transporter [Planctomycetaceae bacterium]
MTAAPETTTATAPTPTIAATWPTWLLIGATGFGGPAGQAALLHRELVERRKWLAEDEYLAALRVCMLLPGPEAQQLATYAGWRLHGIVGGLVSGTLFVLPGAVLVAILAWLHAAGRSLPLVAAAFAGTRPAAVALVALAAWRIGRKSIRSAAAVAIAVAAAAALAGGLPFPLVVAGAAAVGCVLLPRRTRGSAAHGPVPGDRQTGRSLARHAALVASVATLIWALGYAAVAQLGLAGGRGPAIATLFTETTLLSLGGAYAMVPWALDEAVGRGWLLPEERLDALAMGEATPGPLILVVTFIAFLAGWRAGTPPTAAGFEGAAVATAFAFLPSFALILAVAPAVRRIAPGSLLARAMEGVGAAVVAAIVMLAISMARTAFLPAGGADPLAMAVAAASGLALSFRWLPTPLVILAAAAVGATAAWFGC